MNDSDSEVRFLNIHTPDAGFAGYMRGRRDGDQDATFDTADPPADGGLPLSEAVVAGPGEGQRLAKGNRVALLKSALPHLCLAEFELEAGFEGPPLHEHEGEVDSFYVLDGELEVAIEDDRHVAGPETLASVPPGVRHTFGLSGAPARLLNIHAPESGFADFLRRVSD
jgi:quercetin dioxygenase-like cupin family protein